MLRARTIVTLALLTMSACAGTADDDAIESQDDTLRRRRDRRRDAGASDAATTTTEASTPADAAAPPPSGPAPTATRLFASGFESGVTLPGDGQLISLAALKGEHRMLSGSDVAGYSWPGNVFGVGMANTGILAISGNHRNSLAAGAGPDGSRALHLKTESCSAGGCQDNLQIYPDAAHAGDTMYFRYAIKLEADLVARLGAWGWRALAMFKTGSGYRVELYIYTDKDGNPYWFVHGDNVDDTGLQYPGRDAAGNACVALGKQHDYWNASNRVVPIPEGRWVDFELMWKRGARNGNDGRFYFSVDGNVVFDENRSLWPSIADGTPFCNDGSRKYQAGPIRWGSPIMLYTNAAPPRQVHIDDYEIWDGLPCASAPCTR